MDLLISVAGEDADCDETVFGVVVDMNVDFEGLDSAPAGGLAAAGMTAVGVLVEGVGTTDEVSVVIVVAVGIVREAPDTVVDDGVGAGRDKRGKVVADAVGRDGPATTTISSSSIIEIGAVGVAGDTGNCVIEVFEILGVSGRTSKALVLVLGVGSSGDTDPTTLPLGASLVFFALG